MMSTETPVSIESTSSELHVEFRCSRCYQIRHEPESMMNAEASCPYCSNTQTVPQVAATELKSIQHVAAASSQTTVEQGQYDEERLSREEVAAIARDRAEKKTTQRNEKYGGSGFSHADVMTRASAVVIDTIIQIAVALLSFGLGTFISSLGVCPPLEEFALAEDISPITIAAYGLLSFAVNFVIWMLIARLGQSPGKMLMGIKIVGEDGNPPGFFRGVILRGWLANLLFNLIPGGSLIDYGMAWFLDPPPRCGHDYLAGTYVVDG